MLVSWSNFFNCLWYVDATFIPWSGQITPKSRIPSFEWLTKTWACINRHINNIDHFARCTLRASATCYVIIICNEKFRIDQFAMILAMTTVISNLKEVMIRCIAQVELVATVCTTQDSTYPQSILSIVPKIATTRTRRLICCYEIQLSPLSVTTSGSIFWKICIQLISSIRATVRSYLQIIADCPIRCMIATIEARDFTSNILPYFCKKLICITTSTIIWPWVTTWGWGSKISG